MRGYFLKGVDKLLPRFSGAGTDWHSGHPIVPGSDNRILIQRLLPFAPDYFHALATDAWE
jgi:hypothetical protein